MKPDFTKMDRLTVMSLKFSLYSAYATIAAAAFGFYLGMT